MRNKKENIIITIDTKILEEMFPSELMEHFEITALETLCDVTSKTEFYVIEFREKNILPLGYDASEYESKGFMASKLIQDFPLRGKPVFLRICVRRWRHKQTQAIIKKDFTFIADGSKFTRELSDFLKDAGSYANRYHEQHSELLWD